MEGMVYEANGFIYCKIHHQHVYGVILSDNCPEDKMLPCLECIDMNNGEHILASITNAQTVITEMIAAKGPTQGELMNMLLLLLKNLDGQIQKITADHLQNIANITEAINLIIKQIESPSKESKLTKLLKSIRHLKRNGSVFDDFLQFYKSNESFFQKIDSAIEKVLNFTGYMQCQDQIQKILIFIDSQSDKEKEMIQNNKAMYNESQQICQNINLENQIPTFCEVELCQKEPQSEWSIPSQFNEAGNQLITGKNGDIKLWDFDQGKLISQIELKGHDKGFVFCLQSSKKNQWIISGGADSSIKCHKKLGDGNWLTNQPYKNQKVEQEDSVMDLKLNKDESELISCHWRGAIIVWKTKYSHNDLESSQIFENAHQGAVYCISLNDDESQFVSCGEDKKINLWQKDKYQKWKPVNYIMNDDYGKKISFISNDTIIWQQTHIGIIHLFKVINGKLFNQQILQLDYQTDDHQQFPIVFNKNKQIIIVNHHQYIYILRYLPSEGLKSIAKPIDCNGMYNYGTLSSDGEFLVVWTKNEFLSYRLKIIKES